MALIYLWPSSDQVVVPHKCFKDAKIQLQVMLLHLKTKLANKEAIEKKVFKTQCLEMVT